MQGLSRGWGGGGGVGTGHSSGRETFPGDALSFGDFEVKVLAVQSCLTLCNPMDRSPPGSCVHVFLQARILEWVAFPSPGDLPDPEIEPGSPALQAHSLSSETPGTLGGFSPSLTPRPGSAEPQGPTRHCLPAGGSHNSLPEPHTVHRERPQCYQQCHCH